MDDEGSAARRRRRRRAPDEAGPTGSPKHHARPAPAQPAPAQPAPAEAPTAQRTPEAKRPERPRRSRPAADTGERGLRDLVGAGPSQLGVNGALRGRDVNRPSEEDLAEAEANLVIVRRNWQPPDVRK